MDEKLKKLIREIRPVKEEVKQFVNDDMGYYGVTKSGFLFMILRCRTFTPPIEDSEQYDTYMWLYCEKGFFMLRQRFLEGKPLEWILESEIIPETFSNSVFREIDDLFCEQPELLKTLCCDRETGR